jgi:rubrerythrin
MGIVTIFLISFTVLLFVLIVGTVRWIWKHLKEQIKEENEKKEHIHDVIKFKQQRVLSNELEDLFLEVEKDLNRSREELLKDQIKMSEELQNHEKEKDKWECKYCGHRNPPNITQCEYCGMKKDAGVRGR